MVPLADDEIGRRIRAARKAKGWTNLQLAQAMNVGERTVYRWQRGEELPRLTGPRSLARLAEVLEVPVGHLFRNEEEAVVSELRTMFREILDRLPVRAPETERGLRREVAELAALVEKLAAVLEEQTTLLAQTRRALAEREELESRRTQARPS